MNLKTLRYFVAIADAGSLTAAAAAISIAQPALTRQLRELEADLGVTGMLDENSAQPMVVRLSIADSGRELEFPVSKEVTLGRLDAASATFPDVDLTPDNGLEKGVSRRHARITRKASELYLEDLGSVNGTYLNGKRLTPYLPHALKDEDEIRLSRILMHVYFA